jgi:DNA-binding XRE family transcriptional regulator
MSDFSDILLTALNLFSILPGMDEKLQSQIDPWSGFSGLCKQLGRRICRLRTNRGWQQANLAAALGIHRTTLCDYEKGKGAPSLRVLVGLALLFDLDLEVLILGRSVRRRRETTESVPFPAGIPPVRFDPPRRSSCP